MMEIYNGADDDGSGTVALLEAQKHLLGKKGRRGNGQNVLFYFACYCRREKKGLHGSRY
jgi:Zn-dependent M28 family amino/carboxypeptidase